MRKEHFINARNAILLAVWSGAGLAGGTLLALSLWLLLATLGDEVGAAAAWMLAISGGVGLILVQILLINLLALRTAGVKIELGTSADCHEC